MSTEPSREALITQEPVRKLSESQRREIAKRLYAIAEALGETLTSKRIDLYCQCLADLNYPRLLSALSQGLLKFKWFPKIPEIREMVLGSQEVQKELHDADADAAWNHVLAYADRWHPDIGEMSDCPRLTDREIYALRAVGGVLTVQENFGGKALPFIRKDFVAVWKRAIHTFDQPQLGPDTRPERREITDGFQHISEVKPN